MSEIITVMRKIIALLFLSQLGFSAFAQEKELLKIGNEKISVQEFERLYQKNNSEIQTDSLQLSVDEYLDLFIAFKLKVMEAKRLEYDTVKAFKDEIAGYRKELSEPYLTNITCGEDVLKEMYRRSVNEVKARHILFRLKSNAPPADTFMVYSGALRMRKALLDGANFNQMAKQYSQDPSAKNNGGELGYFKAFMMVSQFEDVAYKLKKNEISMPVRTRFGYHLIQLEDIRPASGEIKVAHIMKFVPKNAPDSLRERKLTELKEIIKQINNGTDFSALASKLSDDKRSAMDGGMLPWFNRGRMVPEFADAAYKLKQNGELSGIVTTPYGYHVIKRIDYKELPAFDEIKADLIQKIKSDPIRSKHNKKQFVEKLKEKYNLQENVSLLKKISVTKADSIIADSVLLTFSDQKISVKDLKEYLSQSYSQKPNTRQIELLYKKFVPKLLLEYEDAQLENNYPEFRMLMDEYTDGILLFNISQDKIWDKANANDGLLQRFYNNYSPKEMWKEHFQGVVLECKNAEIAQNYRNKLKSEQSKKDFLTNLPAKSEDLLKVNRVKAERGSNDWVDYYIWNINPLKEIDLERFVVVGDVFPPKTKTLEEARGNYILKLQEQLEKSWIEQLKKRYKVKIRKKVLRHLEKQYANL